MLRSVIILSTALLGFVSAETAYFSFNSGNETPNFVVRMDDDALIAQARNQQLPKILSGRIIKGTAEYNSAYNFYIDPSSIEYLDYILDSCAFSPADVNSRVSEACNAFLPGCLWCPLQSLFLTEVQP